VTSFSLVQAKRSARKGTGCGTIETVP